MKYDSILAFNPANRVKIQMEKEQKLRELETPILMATNMGSGISKQTLTLQTKRGHWPHLFEHL